MRSRPASLQLRLALAVASMLGMTASSALAQSVVAASPDITLSLFSGTLVTSDEDVAVDNGGLVVLENLGTIPGNADVTAHGGDLNGDRFFALDTTAQVGGIVASRGDVIRFDGATHSIEFDASAQGVPSGAITDAVSLGPDGLLLSFDTTIDLAGLVVADEDLVRWNGASFTMALDGSAAGMATSLDVDAAQDLGGGSFLVSLDTTGQLGSVVFDDEDVLRFDGSTWSLEFDASAADSNWAAADLDAVMVPEPGFAALLGFGLAALVARARSRA